MPSLKKKKKKTNMRAKRLDFAAPQPGTCESAPEGEAQSPGLQGRKEAGRTGRRKGGRTPAGGRQTSVGCRASEAPPGPRAEGPEDRTPVQRAEGTRGCRGGEGRAAERVWVTARGWGGQAPEEPQQGGEVHVLELGWKPAGAQQPGLHPPRRPSQPPGGAGSRWSAGKGGGGACFDRKAGSACR